MDILNKIIIKMPKFTKGILIKTDIASKIFLKEHADRDKFIIMDLDDRHLFIYDGKLDLVKKLV